MEDTSLDQFLDRGDEESPDDAPGTDDGAAPAATTYRFDPDGARCADCGERVPTRWRDGERFVCRSCKSW